MGYLDLVVNLLACIGSVQVIAHICSCVLVSKKASKKASKKVSKAVRREMATKYKFRWIDIT